MHGPALTPQMLLAAYAQGLFPMAERRDDPTLYWVSPEMRGILPLDGFHVPRRLARTVRSGRFTVTVDRAFAAVMRRMRRAARRAASKAGSTTKSCGSTARWPPRGHAHSVECWRDGKLVGGLYGVKLGGGVFRRKHVLPPSATPARWRWCIWWRR